MSTQSPDAETPAKAIAVHHYYDPFELPDPATPSGESVARRLREERFIWLTTVDENDVPQPLPVTFLWDESQSTLLTYSRTDRGRLEHIQRNPKVALHFDVSGGDIIIITGEAHVSADDLASDQIPAWVEKYRDLLGRLGMTPKQSAESASVPLRIRPLTLRYTPNPT
jgi:PPOX class probable F420-dependent enzyme